MKKITTELTLVIIGKLIKSSSPIKKNKNNEMNKGKSEALQNK